MGDGLSIKNSMHLVLINRFPCKQHVGSFEEKKYKLILTEIFHELHNNFVSYQLMLATAVAMRVISFYIMFLTPRYLLLVSFMLNIF